MLFNNTKKTDAEIDKLIGTMLVELESIYKNKSSDEYKMCGDITRSTFYDDIERMIGNLTTLKNYPPRESKDLHAMFNVLHRPVFKKECVSFLHEPNDRNIMFTVTFTVGYRVLVGELSRIYASTEATDKGIIYKPDKISRRENLSTLIRAYTNNIETKLDTYIRSKMENGVHTESFAAIMAPIVKGVSTIMGFIKAHDLIEWGSLAVGGLKFIFGGVNELNPVSYVDDVLSKSYDQKVAAFSNVCNMYNATKEAYDEYMKIPEAQRNKKVESKYIKNLNKYNIQMKNLQAKLKHYDKRAADEAADNQKTFGEKIAQSNAESKPDSAKTNESSNETTNDDEFDF